MKPRSNRWIEFNDVHVVGAGEKSIRESRSATNPDKETYHKPNCRCLECCDGEPRKI